MELNETEEYILQLIRPLIGDKYYYGHANIQFQAGEVVDVDLNRKLKPPWSKKKGGKDGRSRKG